MWKNAVEGQLQELSAIICWSILIVNICFSAVLVLLPWIMSNYAKGKALLTKRHISVVLMAWCQFMLLHFMTWMESGRDLRFTATLLQALGPGPKNFTAQFNENRDDVVLYGKKIKQFANIVTSWNADNIMISKTCTVIWTYFSCFFQTSQFMSSSRQL